MNQYSERRKALAKNLEDHSIALLFSAAAPHKSEDTDYTYTPNRNFYYLTGITRPNMILMLAKQGETVTETLFIEEADPVQEKWVGRRMKVDQARQVSGIKAIQFLGSFEAVLGRHLARKRCDAVYLDLGRSSWGQSLSKAHEFAAELRTKHPAVHIRNAHPLIADLRLIKSEDEVANIRKAIDITRLGIENLMANAKPGMMEYELEAYYDFQLRLNGVHEPGFTSIIASGENGVILHYEENDQQTKDGDLVLLDLGAQHKCYSADISRTFPVNGKFTERQKEVYNVVLSTEEAIIQAVKPGVTWKRLNDLTKRLLADGLKSLGLIQDDSEVSRYYYHSVGHQLGLNVHDVTTLDENDPLQPGMVITIEPGLYIEEESIGIRIEDDVLVTNDGGENLSKSILKTVEEIEAFMAQSK